MKDVTVAHFGDIHYGPKLLEEVDRCFTAAIDECSINPPDLFVIAGDSTDHALSAHEPAFRALVTQVRRASVSAPVFMLQGTFSHEPRGTIEAIALVNPERICAASEPGIWGYSTQSGWEAICSGDGCEQKYAFVIFALPSLNKATWVAQHGRAWDLAYKEAIDVQMQVFARFAASARSAGVPSLLVAHGTVLGAITEQGQTLNGSDHEFSADQLFASGAQAIMLAHIHQAQSWTRNSDAQVIAYCNSVGRLHFGDHGEKGYLRWKFGNGAVSAQVMQTPARQMFVAKTNGIPEEADIQGLLGQVTSGGDIKICYAEEANCSIRFDQAALQKRLLDAGATSVLFERALVQLESARSPEILKAQSLEEQLALWLTSVGKQGRTTAVNLLLQEVSQR